MSIAPAQAPSVDLPNIFDYAPSELTQDAFICWLARWADESFRLVDPELHQQGQRFVESLIAKADREVPPIRTVRPIRQWRHIDALLVINDDRVVVIEDKTFTAEHGGQLERYQREAEAFCHEQGMVGIEPVLIYFKLGNESFDFEDRRGSFFRYRRSDLLPILADPSHPLVGEFLRYVSRIEQRTACFRAEQIGDWTGPGAGFPKEGFYQWLQQQIGSGEWRHVSNRSGGFMGFWWHEVPLDGNLHCYLQLIDGSRLEVRMTAKGGAPVPTDQRRALLDALCVAAGDSGDGAISLGVEKSGRWGRGVTVGVASLTINETESILASDCDGRIDLASSLEAIKSAECLLDNACRRVGSLPSHRSGKSQVGP